MSQNDCRRQPINPVALWALGLSISLTACTQWPDAGRGGMAEHYVNATYSNMHEIEPDQPISAELGLNFEFHQLKQQLAILILEGAERCFPASVLQAQRNQARIVREIQTNMLLDAANDLIIQRQHLHQLQQRLDYVRQHATCQAVAQAEQNFPFEQVDAWLNSDNQFAVDSAAINPKYMGHLARAAEPLRAHPQWRLQITGHTDNQGSDQHNHALSKARAQQVSRYLQIFGVDPQRITLKAVASTEPLVAGSEPQVRLTNRRVTIRLIPPAIGSSLSNLETSVFDNSVPPAYISDGWRPSIYPTAGGFIEYHPDKPIFTEKASHTLAQRNAPLLASPPVDVQPLPPQRYSGLPAQIPTQLPTWAQPELLTPNATAKEISSLVGDRPRTLPLTQIPPKYELAPRSANLAQMEAELDVYEAPFELTESEPTTPIQTFDPNPIRSEQNLPLPNSDQNQATEQVLLDDEVATWLDEDAQP